MIQRQAILICVLLVGAAGAARDTVPTWLDTVAPALKVSPAGKYHKGLFHVELHANEPANIWVALGDPSKAARYKNPITIVNEGQTTVYYYGEDYVGNRTPLDSIEYVVDAQAPILSITPEPGRYRSAVVVYMSCSEAARLYRHTDPDGKDAVSVGDSMIVPVRFEGYISAIDSAGNRTTSGKLSYLVDTSSVFVAVEPDGGLFNERKPIGFRTKGKVEVFYTFDPLAPPKWFTPYTAPVELPHGLTLVRYYGRGEMGAESPIHQASFVVDTVAPRVRLSHRRGATHDTIAISSKEQSVITYSLSEAGAVSDQNVYTEPLVFPHQGRGYVRAVARDKAGNVSEIVTWEHKYDKVAPVVAPHQRPGVHTKPFSLTFGTSEPARIFYTLDGSEPGKSSQLYRDGIQVSRPGATVVRYFGVDEAGNESVKESARYDLDIQAPKVKVRIDGNVAENSFKIALSTGEDARIYYEVGDRTPSTSSPVYGAPLQMRTGQSLRYFAVDDAGNRSEVFVMDDLQRPMANISPEGGVYSKRIRVRFETNMPSTVHYRLLPDTAFQRARDTIEFAGQGLHTIEYFSETSHGLRSPLRRNEYLLDWTAPHAEVSVRKGIGDSVNIFIECNENATIYYTLDGTNPAYSRDTRIASNKLYQSRARISVARTGEARLAFFTEDAAGNQSSVTVLDVFKPRAVPSVPAGRGRTYDRILSVSLNTLDERSQVHYERHGRKPTMESPIFSEPLTLVASDTILAFVVDASGYRGEVDTFFFQIDLPPSVLFAVNPDTLNATEEALFDGSKTVDHESASGSLRYRWDFDGDGVFDVDRRGEAKTRHAYRDPGRYRVMLEVIDSMGRKGASIKEVLVRGFCPKDMVYVATRDGRRFCIDKYEWPNKGGRVPHTGVSWVQAKMHCLDAGKRLCEKEEWEFACDGGRGSVYPYGTEYEANRCPTVGDEPFAAGTFSDCREAFGLHDMVGNVWEWVEDRSGFQPLLAGGTHKHGRAAHCRLQSAAHMVAQPEDTGFRCCK